ncbi:hypothetical protein [Vibrio sp. SCSIO 43137]|uniref:hypothetical protein n=1 Tax=Vibrio sp. SCSIO 43137 TaxID=3021011 RepID=UPI0023082B60|nr:hypothetical protein [Vibrio sp. SCSIO 43137]WCE30685.1 hypothetical protein PK654_05270 [Vibrio sp. SCSIO 43137]
MVESNNYQMAIDLLCCHLGISEEEAKEQLGISENQKIQQQIANAQQSMISYTSDK